MPDARPLAGSGPWVPRHAAPARAGFPSPAHDYLEPEVDLAGLLAPRPRSTRLEPFHARAGRAERLFLVVDTGLRPLPGDLVLARVDGERMPARFARGPGGARLLTVDGTGIEAAEAVTEGVATWSLRGYRDGPRTASGFDFLVTAPHATFLFAVAGDSMRDAGIRDGDVLVVDRSLPPRGGDVVVAVVDGARAVKRLVVENGRARLAFENADYGDLFLPLNPETAIYGVVTWGLHRLRAPASGRRTRR